MSQLIPYAVAGARATRKAARYANSRARIAYSSMRVPRPIYIRHRPMTVIRTSATSAFGLTAGVAGANADVTANVVQTADLISMFDQYKIKWVEAVFTANYDPGQSGVTNNSVISCWVACDPTAQYANPTNLQVGAFENHKQFYMTAGKTFVYRFYPKAINSIAAGNTAITNDWLLCTSTGVAVNHQRLYFAAQAQNTSDAQAVQVTYRLCIQLRNIS